MTQGRSRGQRTRRRNPSTTTRLATSARQRWANSRPAQARRRVHIVAGLDLRATSRRRASWISLACWVAFIYGLLLLTVAGTGGGNPGNSAGALVHSLIASATLTGLIVLVPYLGAGALTRSRDTGLLDMFRITQLGARDISWGVFAGTLVRIAALLAVTAPALVTGFALGGSDASGLVLTFVVVGSVALAIAASAQAASALFATRTAALVTAYALTGLLVCGPPMLYALALPLTSETVNTQVRVLSGTQGTTRTKDGPACTVIWAERTQTRSDRLWWLLAFEPYVGLADAAPGRITPGVGFEPLSALRTAVRSARIAPDPASDTLIDECPISATASAPASATASTPTASEPNDSPPAAHGLPDREAIEAVPPTWPITVALMLALTLAGIGVSTRSLTAPGRAARGWRRPQDRTADREGATAPPR